MFVPCGESVPDLAGFTLLMPAVSVGNVGQLAIDLIISTLNMCKIGYFYTDCLVPMVGNNPYATSEEDSAELSINAEVYSLPSKKLVALQLRSIFIKYKSKPFCEKLLSWVKSSNCAKVIVLSSSHSYHRNDLQLRRYLLTPSMQKSVQNKIKSLNWEEMEKSQCIPETHDSEFCIRIPGGGITKTLYDEGISSRSTSLADGLLKRHPREEIGCSDNFVRGRRIYCRWSVWGFSQHQSTSSPWCDKSFQKAIQRSVGCGHSITGRVYHFRKPFPLHFSDASSLSS
ncbi:proteasome assembly chaperone 2 isoform X2 [Rousettus aegyptiacus]|uniref:proteasome assembly chaperone 2 isoform X2 n=1 Tax=Rousettus aegyptiacus TaxID=9407 RepID=UPI00168CF036|nr:proteasome assembly chaperone 2 isoform X2 [Rousettus aegyptiacus]